MWIRDNLILNSHSRIKSHHEWWHKSLGLSRPKSKRWFCWVIVFSPANSQMVTMKPGLVGMDNIQWIYAVVVNSVLFPRRGLANVQPWSNQTDRTCAVTTIPLAAWCIYPSGIMPVNAKLLVARSCQAARQGTRHLALCLDSAKPGC